MIYTLRLDDEHELLDLDEMAVFVFTTLEKAQSFAQTYSNELLAANGFPERRTSLQWRERGDDRWYTSYQGVNYVINRLELDPSVGDV